MKVAYTLLLCLLTLGGYCQDYFTYTLNGPGNKYFVNPDFEEFSTEGKEQSLFVIRDKEYLIRKCDGVVKATIPQHQLDSLSVPGSTMSLYIDSKGEVFYIYFTLLKSDRRYLSDENLYALHQKLKSLQVDISKMEVVPEQVTWSGNQNGVNKIYYSRLTLPFIPYTIEYSSKASPRTVTLKPIEGGPLALNRPFPAMTLRTVDGEIIETSSLKGKVVMYNFYDPKNPVCIAETKGLSSLCQKYRKDSVIFISVAFAGDDVIRKFHKAYRSQFKAVSWDEKDMNELALMVRQYPTNVIVSPYGRVVLVRKGGVDDSKYMKECIITDFLPVIDQELKQVKRLNEMQGRTK